MRCCDVEALWDDLRDGAGVDRDVVLAHLRSCPPCQRMYEQYEGIAYCLTCLPVVEPPGNLVPRIIEHLAATIRAARKPDGVAKLDSPVGALYVAFRSSGITAVAYDRGEGDERAHAAIAERLRRAVSPTAAPAWVTETVQAFFRTFRAAEERVDITDLTPFEQLALRAAAQIPPGEVRTYGWLAAQIGSPHAASAVGRVIARNPVRVLYPCHRVVDASGQAQAYGCSVEVRSRMLELEGYVAGAPAKIRVPQQVTTRS